MTLDSQKMHRTHDGRAAQDPDHRSVDTHDRYVSLCAHVTQATGADQ
jgi:hypothetical protein